MAKRRTFAADLDAMLTTVVTELGRWMPGRPRPADPVPGGAGDVLGRTDDSTGRIHGIYERAAAAGHHAHPRPHRPEAAAMALRLVERLDGRYGLVERLPARPHRQAACEHPARPRRGARGRHAAGRRADYRALAERHRLLRMRQALADRTGDVDAFTPSRPNACPRSRTGSPSPNACSRRGARRRPSRGSAGHRSTSPPSRPNPCSWVQTGRSVPSGSAWPSRSASSTRSAKRHRADPALAGL